MIYRMLRQSQRGVALLEAMVAIFIFSIGILAVIGMQASSIRNSSEAKYRAQASFLANQIIGQIWADQANISTYASRAGNCAGTGTTSTNTDAIAWLNTVASTLPGATAARQGIQIDTSNNQVTVTVCWQTAPGATSYHNHVVTARIQNNT